MKKYTYFLKVNFQQFLEYRTDLVINLLLKFSVFIAFYFIWKSISESGSEIDGYGLNGIVVYYLLSIILHGLTTSQTARDMRDSIISGNLSNQLIEPVNLGLFFLSKHFGRVLSETMINFLLTLPILILFPSLIGELNLDVLSLSSFIVISILASVLNFMLYFTIGLIAFWTKQASGLQSILRNSARVFTGELIPIDLLPLTFQNILKFLPFPYIMFVPISLIMKGYDSEVFIRSLITMLIWILVMVIINIYIWKKGLKKYESVGI